MIHWAFLIPAFIAGIVLGWFIVYQLAKIAAQVEAAIDKAAEGAPCL